MDEDLTNSGREGDYLTVDIACLNPRGLHAALVSTVGSHCEVWRSSKRSQDNGAGNAYFEFVIKYPRGNHSQSEIAILAKHYRMLRQELDDVVPEAIFTVTRVDGKVNVCVIARAVNIWFDIANTQNREEAIELLRTHAKTRVQLERFIQAAKAWRSSSNPRLIDLFGVNNLVIDTNHEIRYLDSFYVFFFEDMLDLLQEPDAQLEHHINRSIERLEYLEGLLGE